MRDDDALENNPYVSKSELRSVHEALFSWSMSRCNFERAVAEDLMQQAYVEIISGRARFDNKSTLKTFLFGVVQKLALSRMKRVANRLRLIREHWAGSEPGFSPEVVDMPEGIWQAVEKLPARQRDITELVFCRDMTIEEASRVMGVSVGTGRVHYDRAKKALAISLAGMGAVVGLNSSANTSN